MAGNASAFTGGNPAAPEGAQVAFIQGRGAGNALISQSLAGWKAATCKLTLSAVQRAHIQSGRQDFRVLLDGVSVGTVTPTSTNYLEYNVIFAVRTAGTHTLALQGINSTGGDNTAFVDNLRLAVVPKPPYFAADANGDGRVDVTDLGILATNFNKPPSPAGRPGGDFNNDGAVNVSDLGILATHFNRPAGATASSPSFQQAMASFRVPPPPFPNRPLSASGRPLPRPTPTPQSPSAPPLLTSPSPSAGMGTAGFVIPANLLGRPLYSASPLCVAGSAVVALGISPMLLARSGTRMDVAPMPR